MLRSACLALALLGSVALLAEAVPAAKEPAGGGDFQKIFAEWKGVLAKLRKLQEQYQLSPTKERPKLEAEYNEILKRGQQLAPQLTVAAQKAYTAAPNTNKEVSDFLFTNLRDDVRSDSYEEAFRGAQILIDHNYPNKDIYNLGFVAAFMVNEYELAERYLKLAVDSGTLDDESRKLAHDFEAYKKYWEQESAIRQAEAKADDLPRVKLSTSKGDIVIELFENEAPNSVANFISLVESHFYDGLKFHRVIPRFMAQGGDPQGNGSGGPGYHIPCECYQKNHRIHFRGTLSMAHAGRDTGGSQFFLTFVPTSHLNGKHTAFGRVIEGMEVLAKLQRTEPARGEPDKIIKATVVRKRKHKYEPVKVAGK